MPRWSWRAVLALGAATCAATAAVGDWIGGLAIVVLWLIWMYLQQEGGVPVLAAALTFQWLQVTIGLWYYAATGRRLDTMELSDYRPMVLIGLGCCAALGAGLYAGISLVKRRQPPSDDDGALIPISWPALATVYVIATAMQGVLSSIAYDVPGLTQPILAMRFVRLAAVFVVFRRLCHPVPRWPWIAAVVGVEVVLGTTGFFAGFREPLVMAAIALYEAFDNRRISHWIAAGTLATLAAVLSVMWMNVRRDFRESFDDETFAASRQAKMDRMVELASNWWKEDTHDARETDKLVDRLWTIYYPALAVSRVPSVLPHTDGSLMQGALQHVLNPRLFFPTKAELQSDSEMVRKYSGLYVASTEQNTSIAFGYAAESYIDFGMPMMFLPMFLYALAMGMAFQFLAGHISHAELRAGLLAVIFWLSLYLFERSWVKILGLAGTLLIYLGGPALLCDYYLSRWERRRPQIADPEYGSYA